MDFAKQANIFIAAHYYSNDSPFLFTREDAKDPYFNFVNLLIIGFLMISKIPTFDIKSINFKTKYSPWIILIIVVICVGLLSNVWMSLVILGLIYVIS